MKRLAAITFATGENSVCAGSIDSVGDYAYFGLETDPAKIVKVRLSDFTKDAVLTLNSGEIGTQSMSISTNDAYLYIGTGATPIDIVKVRLSDFTRQGAISWTIERGSWVGRPNLVVSSTNLYFGTTLYPDKILRITVPALGFTTLIDSLLTGETETNLKAGIIDIGNNYAYWGTATRSPAKIWRLNLATFTVDSLTLNTGENDIWSGVIDTTNGFAYFGTNQIPAKIIKIRLSNFTRVGSITLNTGENELRGAAAISIAAGFAYFATYTSPARVISIDLETFTRFDALTLNVGESYGTAAVIDTINWKLYVGCGAAPGRVVKLGILPYGRCVACEVDGTTIGGAGEPITPPVEIYKTIRSS